MPRVVSSVAMLAFAAVIAAPGLQHLADKPAEPAVEAPVQAAVQPIRKASGLQLGDVLIAANAQGHFRIDAQIQGRAVSFMADTGATTVALRESEARRIGLPVMPADYTIPVETANGTVKGARIVIPEITVAQIRVGGVTGIVLPDNALGTNLLGMTFLGRLKGFQVAGDRLILSN